jgi:hypothetical protein
MKSGDKMNTNLGKIRIAAILTESLEPRLLLAAAPAGILGDLNGDGKVDAADIDALAAQIQSPTPDPACDLNGDGKVDAQDFNHLVVDLLATRPGDANLDGRVDGCDFLAWQVNYPTLSGAIGRQGEIRPMRLITLKQI